MMGLNLFGLGGDYSGILDPGINSRNWGGGLTQLGGMLPPMSSSEKEELTEEEKEELSLWERFGAWRGEQDLYDKEMGITPKDYGGMFASRKAEVPQATSIGQLAALSKLASPRQKKTPMNFQDMIRSKHIRTLMGG